MTKNIFAFLLFFAIIPAFADVLTDNADTPEYIDDTGIEWYKFSCGYVGLDENTEINAAGLNPGDWRAFYKEETEVLGTSTCNNVDDTNPRGFVAGEQRGVNCWCKIIAVTNDVKKTTPSKWVYRGQFEGSSECANLCTTRCAYNFLADTDYRAEILNK